MARRPLDEKQLLRTIAHALRHNPMNYGLEIDPIGWVDLNDLIMAMRFHRFEWEGLVSSDVEAAIGNAASDRFEIRNGRIRATYGHSIYQEAILPCERPPTFLYHGTADSIVPEIYRHGLLPMNRRYVHLTADLSYAWEIGNTKGNGVVLLILTELAQAEEFHFWRGNRHVWLARAIPPRFIRPNTAQPEQQITP